MINPMRLCLLLVYMDKGEERKLLSVLYPNTPNAEIARRLGISVGMVCHKARFLGLKKDHRYLSETNRSNGMKSSFGKTFRQC